MSEWRLRSSVFAVSITTAVLLASDRQVCTRDYKYVGPMTQQICCYFLAGPCGSVSVCTMAPSQQLPWLVSMETQSSHSSTLADKHWESPQPPTHLGGKAWTTRAPTEQEDAIDRGKALLSQLLSESRQGQASEPFPCWSVVKTLLSV